MPVTSARRGWPGKRGRKTNSKSNLKVIEVFVSRQGEGLWTGTHSTFVRFGGCNLRCGFCDTRYASWECEKGEDLSPEEIAGLAILYGLPHVVLTGGEPMLDAQIVPLTKLLAERNFDVTVETNGTFDRQVSCALMSISPKLSNSSPADPEKKQWHDLNRFRPDVVRNLVDRYFCQLKFVVDTPADLEEIDRYLSELGPFDLQRVFLMPQAQNVEQMRRKEEWLRHCCQARGYTYSPRMQLEWYGGVRGK